MEAAFATKESKQKNKPAEKPMTQSAAGMPLFLQCSGLAVNVPGDVYEQEADRAADIVMRQSYTAPPLSRASSHVQRCGCGECEECRAKSIPKSPLGLQSQIDKKLVQLKASGQGSGGMDAPPQVHGGLRTPGQPLDVTTRDFMESGFGADFGGVRIHHDSESARAVNARAYTVGQDVVFGAGQYAPGTMAGNRLIAHELAHTLQQSSGMMRLQRVCGPDEVGEVEGCNGLSGDILGETFLFNVNCDTFLPGEEDRLREFARLVDPGDKIEIHGFASEEGPSDFNDNLSCLRAWKGFQVLLEEGITTDRMLPVFQHGATAGPRPERRSIVIDKTPAEPEATPQTCDTVATATTFAEYVHLVACAEAALGLSPRDILSFLGQLYYSPEPWSMCRGAGCQFFNDVIPCRVAIADPRPALGTALYDALIHSKVVAGADMGHVFTGLEAMVCPLPEVELETPGPNWVVQMPNEEFATWGGDLGSAAAQKVHDEEDLGNPPAPWSTYFGTPGTLASDEDLEGDIDSYGIHAGLTGRSCGAATSATPLTITSPISQILGEYYGGGATALGAARTNRFPCFIETIGGVVVGGRITNKSTVSLAIANRVFEFAIDFYRLKWHAGYFATGGIGTIMMLYSMEVSDLYMDWLESKL